MINNGFGLKTFSQIFKSGFRLLLMLERLVVMRSRHLEMAIRRMSRKLLRKVIKSPRMVKPESRSS